MYVGSSRYGRLHLTRELLANAVDLVLADTATRIQILLHHDGSVEVTDDGPGLHLGEESGLRWFTDYHLTATADGHHPHIHLAWPGLGLAVVTALSTKLRATSTHDGVTRVAEWINGGETRRTTSQEPSTQGQGTSVRFWPDSSIFGDTTLTFEDLEPEVRELNALIPTMDLSLVGDQQSYVPNAGRSWEEGLGELLERVNDEAEIGDQECWFLRGQMQQQGEAIPSELMLGISTSSDSEEYIALWCNYTSAREESEVHRAIRAAFQNRVGAVALDDPLTGLSIVASLTMLDPQFGGPTLSRVDDPRAAAAISAILDERLPDIPDRAFSPLS